MNKQPIKQNLSIEGIAYSVSAYFLWGMLAIYWKQLKSVPSLEILAHRILWSFVFLLLIILLTKNRNLYWMDIKKIRKKPNMIARILLASFFLNINWLTYIWAINHQYIIQTSLGYYINPVFSVLLGVFALQERLTRIQWISFFIVMIGVGFLAFTAHTIPLISFILAISFSLYSLLKKKIALHPLTSLTNETLLSGIPAILYVMWLAAVKKSSFHFDGSLIMFLLIGAGIVTAVPLLLFNHSTKHLPLNIIGIFQYITPTMTLLVGIFLYHETFTIFYLVAFIIIWLGLFVFISQTFQKSKKAGFGNEKI